MKWTRTGSERKGMDSTLALIIAIVVGLLVVVVIVGILNSNTGNLENFALNNIDINLWGGEN
jgi:hypothetical protein